MYYKMGTHCSQLMILLLQLIPSLYRETDASNQTERLSNGISDSIDIYFARYAYLEDVGKDLKYLEEMLAGITNLAIGEKAGKEHYENTEYFQGKAKGFSKRKYVGTITSFGEVGTSGICAKRQHPGIMYAIIDGPKDRADGYDSNIYAFDANNASLVTKISLDVVNVDWEDIACGPCDTGGLGHCIYVSDTGHTGEGPANLIYKVQEPEEVIQGRKLSLGEDEIEVIGFETSLENSETLLVSPNGRLYIMDGIEDTDGMYEIVDGETKFLFHVALPKERWYGGLCGGDVSPDSKAVLLKSKEDVFYWYVEEEEDMESVLTDAKQAEKLPYLPELNGQSIAWSLDGQSYFTVSEGENEPLFRYDRLTSHPRGGTKRSSGPQNITMFFIVYRGFNNMKIGLFLTIPA